MTVQELEKWFTRRELPAGPIWIHKSMKVDDPKQFVALHFSVIQARANEKLNEPAILRLMLMKEWLENN